MFAGAEQRLRAGPVVTPVPQGRPDDRRYRPDSDRSRQPSPARPARTRFAGLLAWLDGLDALGLDGRELNEIGLKNGSLVVDDQRSGKRWNFDTSISSLTRPKEGGVAFAMTRPARMARGRSPRRWCRAAKGGRSIEQWTRDVSPKDSCWRCASMTVARAGHAALGAARRDRRRRHAADGGRPDPRRCRLHRDRAARRAAVFSSTRRSSICGGTPSRQGAASSIRSCMRAANRISFLAQLQPPRQAGDRVGIVVDRGLVVLGGPERSREPPLVLDRFLVRAADRSRRAAHRSSSRATRQMAAGVAISGAFDYGDEPRLTMGIAGTRMSAAALKRLWPVFVAPKVRTWVNRSHLGGTVERF